MLLAGAVYLDGLSVWTQIGLAALALILGIGYFTRVAAAVLAVVAAFGAFELGGRLGIAVGFHAVTAVALAMFGAGAYSIDGRLFGRRIIRFDE